MGIRNAYRPALLAAAALIATGLPPGPRGVRSYAAPGVTSARAKKPMKGGPLLVGSDFDADAEGWLALTGSAVNAPEFMPTGGAPTGTGGFIEFGGEGNPAFYFASPPAFA